MPNRIIKESITTSCEINKLTAEEERLFYRLIVICDDFGRMLAHPSIIRAKCFPLKLDKIRDKDITKWLQSLIDKGLIIIYSTENGKEYLQMATWEKHQQRRAKFSKYPAPGNGVISNDINCNQLQTNVPEESRNRGTRNRECDQFFESIWELYPEKKGKAKVSDTKKQELYELGYEVMKKCVDRYKNHKKDWQEYQHGSTFFNSGYVDYLDLNYEKLKKGTGQGLGDL